MALVWERAVLCRKKEKARSEGGAAALEMALLLPLLLLLIMGILEFGYVFFVDLTLTNAVREGARVGVVVPDENDVTVTAESKVVEYIGEVLGATYVSALDTGSINFDSSTDELEVIATINDYPSLSPFQLLPSSVLPTNISARATMRWER